MLGHVYSIYGLTQCEILTYIHFFAPDYYSRELRNQEVLHYTLFAGAVANGRAKFEGTPKGPEKPSRFFGSRSRTNSPMLPVKTPKVPAAALKDLKANAGTSGINESNSKKEDSNGGIEAEKKEKNPSKPPTLNLVTFSSNKLLSKMKK